MSAGLRPALSVQFNPVRRIMLAIAALVALRLITAAALPLSFDESYFWLWSKHLAVSYYDHPPMIALAIGLGTAIFGDTQWGVHFVPLLASIAASWAIWRCAEVLFADVKAAAIACCLFNLTLMTAAVSASATPDSLLMAASCFLLLAVAKLEATGDGRWWLAAGAAIGFGLLTKYTALFLAGGLGLWTLVTPQGRHWLRSIWPYAGALIAGACIVSTVLWNAAHDWISFKFQFGRVTEGGLNLRYLAEFLGGQLALASPFIAVLAAIGLVRERRVFKHASSLGFAAALLALTFGYFLVHALHSRVQGNWPCFAYPAAILLATSVYVGGENSPRRSDVLLVSRALVIPVAAAILLLSYAQAFFGVFPMGLRDPVARVTAVGFQPVADEISALARKEGAAGIVTTRYVVTGWLSFYVQPHLPIVQITEEQRWISSPRADMRVLGQPLLFVTQQPDKELPRVSPHFAHVALLEVLARERRGTQIDKFYVYALSGFHGPAIGRLP